MVLDLLAELRRIQNADNLETFDQATDSLEAIRDFVAAGLAASQGLCFYGLVTAVPGANQFTCPGLLGLGDDKFLDSGGLFPYNVYVLRDAGGAAAAPQGEHQPVTDYVSATGTFTTAAFTAAVAVGDEVLIIHPFLVAAGKEVTEAVGPYSYLDAGGEQTVYQNEVNTRRRISFEMDLNAMTLNGTIRLYRRVDGANYRLWIEEAFVVAGTEKVFTREGITTNQYFRVTYQESADEGAARAIPYNVIIEALE